MGPGALAGIIGAVAVVLTILAAALTIIPIVVALAYVALRVQDARQTEPDPRLGMKTAFHMMHTISILLVLGGLSVFMIDLMDGAISGNKPNVAPPPNPFGGAAPPARAPRGDSFNAAQRVAVALVVSGLLFGIAFWAFLLGTNDGTRKAVRRVFVGGRMALCLLITIVSVTGLLVVLMQKDPQHQVTEALLAMLIVWFPAACVHMILFFANMGEPRSGRRRRDEDDEEERGWRPTHE